MQSFAKVFHEVSREFHLLFLKRNAAIAEQTLNRCMLAGVVCKVGEERSAVVLHVDSVASCVQLTFNKDTLKAVRAFKENTFTQARLVSLSVHDCLVISCKLLQSVGHYSGPQRCPKQLLLGSFRGTWTNL